MLSWALAFFIIALIAAFFGFGGIAVAANEHRRLSTLELRIDHQGTANRIESLHQPRFAKLLLQTLEQRLAK